MNDVAIQVDGLSKRYRIGERVKYKALRDVLTDAMQAPWRRARALLRGSNGRHRQADDGFFWALKDVSFQVRQGEAVGIIGRNGAGKSTLLKLLSRITAPTTGQAEIRGRVGSLLEVGTGFHPELTGRENIFLNGAILGMRRAEITSKFDEIVAFAEVDRFIDTPVKHYSSGMFVRLAFSVAAHLEPEILLVDEVLAVGDVAFQKKCLGKMGDVTKQGRTVFFVSHNMTAILNFCQRTLLLGGGRLLMSGKTQEVVERYLSGVERLASTPLSERRDRRGEGYARTTHLAIRNAEDPMAPLLCGSRLRIELGYEAERPITGTSFMVGIYSGLGQPLYRLDSSGGGRLADSLPPRGTLVCETQPINLSPGRYIINVAIMVQENIVDHLEQAACFDVEPEDFYGSGSLPPQHEVPCLLKQAWKLGIPNEH